MINSNDLERFGQRLDALTTKIDEFIKVAKESLPLSLVVRLFTFFSILIISTFGAILKLKNVFGDFQH